ncbi:MAG: type II toxin-antitoxin system HicB family antitoxin [bacterium]|nr:type II toxin-antitoxin system HicB family antitoxin [bacterium]
MMKMKIFRYNVVIRKEDKHYIADVPTLGISDFGGTLEAAKKNIKGAIECHIEGLMKTHTAIPRPDTDDYYISTTEIHIPSTAQFA